MKAYEDDSNGMAIFKAHITGDQGTYELIDNGPTGINRIRWRDGNQYVISYKLNNCLFNNAKKFNMERGELLKRMVIVGWLQSLLKARLSKFDINICLFIN
jgi:hypothetical protein